jgi:tRNA-dihydrouridine synthase
VVYTEFATVEGFCRGVEKVLDDFLYDETQRPVVAQIYGTTPDFFRQTATALCELGFDGVDINMGCPAKSVAHSGAGAALIQTPQLAKQIVEATKAGVVDWQNGKKASDCPDITLQLVEEINQRHQQLPEKYQARDRVIPVTVKTRVGFDVKVAREWIAHLLEVEPVAIAIHGRTLRQGYGGEADWDEIGRAVKTARGSGVMIFGNGDVHTHSQALIKVREYGVDGVLIGRGTFGNPWAFLDQEVDIKLRAKVALEHSRYFENLFQKRENYRFLPMRKHLAWYIKETAQASQIRQELMLTESATEVEKILQKYQLLS